MMISLYKSLKGGLFGVKKTLQTRRALGFRVCWGLGLHPECPESPPTPNPLTAKHLPKSRAER